jgi:hypothetical protein
MKNDEDKKQIIDSMENTVFDFDFQKSNNYNSMGFGLHKSTDDMLSILVKLVAIFVRLSRVFTKSS